MTSPRSLLFIVPLALDPLSAETKTLPSRTLAPERSASSKIASTPTSVETAIVLLILAPIWIPVLASEEARNSLQGKMQ